MIQETNIVLVSHLLCLPGREQRGVLVSDLQLVAEGVGGEHTSLLSCRHFAIPTHSV